MRREKILKNITFKSKNGLEIGPLTRPVLNKQEASIKYIDHLSTAGLKKKYKNTPINTKEIVPVDYVLKTSLKETVGKDKFDYVIASHVIEHIPDNVSWLQDVASILKSGGVLSLVIPDKRYTFDIIRDVSKPGDIIGAYLDKQTHFTSAAMYDFATKAKADIIPAKVHQNPTLDFAQQKPIFSPHKARTMIKTNAKHTDYVDCHCFVYTPYSFFEIIKELINLDLFEYEVVGFYDTEPGDMEFFVSLQKSTKSRAEKLETLPVILPPTTKRELQQKNQDLESQLHDTLSSASWKLTRPLRAINAILAGFRSK